MQVTGSVSAAHAVLCACYCVTGMGAHFGSCSHTHSLFYKPLQALVRRKVFVWLFRRLSLAQAGI